MCFDLADQETSHLINCDVFFLSAPIFTVLLIRTQTCVKLVSFSENLLKFRDHRKPIKISDFNYVFKPSISREEDVRKQQAITTFKQQSQQLPNACCVTVSVALNPKFKSRTP